MIQPFLFPAVSHRRYFGFHFRHLLAQFKLFMLDGHQALPQDLVLLFDRLFFTFELLHFQPLALSR